MPRQSTTTFSQYDRVVTFSVPINDSKTREAINRLKDECIRKHINFSAIMCEAVRKIKLDDKR